jgi:hypothetical protein
MVKVMCTHRGSAVGFGILVACAAIALIALWPRAGSAGFQELRSQFHRAPRRWRAAASLRQMSPMARWSLTKTGRDRRRR